MHSLVAPREIKHIRLDGGRPCLDFVNSIHDWHGVEREDYLVTPQRYVAWCIRAGLLSAKEARRIDVAAAGVALMRDVGRFREYLYALLCARIDRKAVPQTALRELNNWLHRAWQGLELNPASPECLRWLPRAVDARLPIKRVALSALDVLRSDRPDRLKRCATDGACGWLFYDETKNNGRQWCSMQTCGAASKMKRYRKDQG
jgi:predicted RNA-binding Zn ribbon-like protein